MNFQIFKEVQVYFIKLKGNIVYGKRDCCCKLWNCTYRDIKKTIEVIENNVKKKYGEKNFERAFTSKRVCHKLKTEKNYLVFNYEEALNALKNKGFNNIVTLSLHILDGVEYKKLNNKYGKISEPLLFVEEDYEKIVENEEFNDTKGNDAIIFVGHGSEDISDKSYEKLQKKYEKAGKNNIFIGTIEGKIQISDILEKLQNTDYKKILIKPFLIVAGKHAKKDIMSDTENSWKTILEKNGYTVETELVGMGEYQFIQEMFMKKLEKILYINKGEIYG